MDRNILSDYIDACEFIKETEKRIKKLEQKKRIVQDKVKGSNPDWPYEKRSFNLGGTIETVEEAGMLQREKRILEIQKREAEELKFQVEEWLHKVPFRMRRIIQYRFFNRLSWEETAILMKAKSENSIKKEFERFMRKK